MTVAILHNWIHAIIKTYQHMDYKQQVPRQIKHILLNKISLTTMLIQEISCSARPGERRALFLANNKPHLLQLRSAEQDVVCMDNNWTAINASIGNPMDNQALHKLRRSEIFDSRTYSWPLDRKKHYSSAGFWWGYYRRY